MFHLQNEVAPTAGTEAVFEDLQRQVSSPNENEEQQLGKFSQSSPHTLPPHVVVVQLRGLLKCRVMRSCLASLLDLARLLILNITSAERKHSGGTNKHAA